jgi:ectoine hydroxylase-related dioxygenase (phytanoyl-CoA dioxygenase family)
MGSMIRRVGKNLAVYKGEPPLASVELERDGYTVLRGVLAADEVAALVAEVEQAFVERDAERGRSDRDEFRYQMLNYGPLTQDVVGHPAILAAIEPLLGGDCHVIANTAWRNPPEFAGGPWHCDAGPHVPRPSDVPWDDRIPYPVFAIGAHLYLWDCPLACGPTAVVPGSHRSGRLAPLDRLTDPALDYGGRAPVLLEARAGDVALFVSDAWHRGTPAGEGSFGRLFLQCHYARRDLAQRLRTTRDVNQLSVDAIVRATTQRERTLVGLHEPYFYDG